MPSGSGSNGGVPAGQSVRVQAALARLESAETHPAERRQQATIENLTGALARLRRGASALRAENAQLRAEMATFRQAEWDSRSAEAVLPETGKLAEIALPADERAPGAARIIIAQCLAGLVAPEVLDNTQLLATELVTNSVRHGELHAGDAAIVRVYLADDAVRVDVENPGTAGVVASNGSDTRIGRGFGLELVGDLAVRWGIRRDRNTHVWFEIERQA
jgi:anti-sigma regulatory factor (Ser/Thr protein kinase)